MFFDSDAWPPPPSGHQPKPATPTLSKREEKTLAIIVGVFLVLLFLSPLAGASVVSAIVAFF